ncbi:MAG: amino acid permease [Rhodobiaceae bacterium]|nr:MAG: amino acid permease [Rhodobiaceae bacterium]
MSSEPAHPKTTLVRRLSVPLLVLYGLGVTIGAGIYVLIGEIAHRAGVYSPYAFMAAAILIAPTTYSFSKLVARFPVSAGEARYVVEGFRLNWLGILVGLMVALAGIVSTATLSVGSIGYLQMFVDIPAPLMIIVIMVLFSGLAIVGIKASVTAAAILTLVEIGGLVALIWAGVLVDTPAIMDGLRAPFVNFDISAIGLIASTSVIAFYAFIGFEDMVNVAEEVKDPARSFPIAIAVTLGVTMVLYFLVSTVAVSLVGAEALGQSNAPITLVAERTGVLSPTLLSAIGALSALNGILIQIIMASRVLYGLSRQTKLATPFSYVSARTHTPIVATMVVAGISLLLALLFPLAGLAEATSRITFVIFILVNGALVALTLREANWQIRDIASWTPVIVPTFGAFGTVGLMIVSLL